MAPTWDMNWQGSYVDGYKICVKLGAFPDQHLLPALSRISTGIPRIPSQRPLLHNCNSLYSSQIVPTEILRPTHSQVIQYTDRLCWGRVSP